MAPHFRSVAFADPWDGAGLQSWAVAYAQEVRKTHSHIPRFKDFRKMFDKMGKDIDAVAISGVIEQKHTPSMGEGNRFLQFVKACEAGAVRGHLAT